MLEDLLKVIPPLLCNMVLHRCSRWNRPRTSWSTGTGRRRTSRRSRRTHPGLLPRTCEGKKQTHYLDLSKTSVANAPVEESRLFPGLSPDVGSLRLPVTQPDPVPEPRVVLGQPVLQPRVLGLSFNGHLKN